MTYYCATCWDDLPDDWPGGICPTCQDDLNTENHDLKENPR